MITQSSIADILRQKQLFLNKGKTKNTDFRLQQLKNLQAALLENEQVINQALKQDLGKSQVEAYLTEINLVKTEIKYAIKNLKKWVKPQKVATPVAIFPATARIHPEPLGVVLIIGAWNYPLLLILLPLIGAIASGNCAILKPSELAPHTSSVIQAIISKHFAPEYISVVEGGVETSQQLLEQKFDHIFFTGGSTVGKIVMAAAAKHLTPVTLELGGKSPCIVDTDINIEHTARRITWGKFINAGQTCIAPDYLLVHESIKSKLLNLIEQNIHEFYGDNPANSPDYPRIINQKHLHRLARYLQSGEIRCGGEINPDNCYIAPTVLDNICLDDLAMQEEIFGPILPVISYTDISEALEIINSRPKPLALYLFSQNKHLQQRILQATSSGGVCINDTLVQCGLTSLPFGGVGNSGMGRYHGKASFDTFTHYKSVLHRSFLSDIKLRYAPYAGKLPLLKRILG